MRATTLLSTILGMKHTRVEAVAFDERGVVADVAPTTTIDRALAVPTRTAKGKRARGAARSRRRGRRARDLARSELVGMLRVSMGHPCAPRSAVTPDRHPACSHNCRLCPRITALSAIICAH